MSGVKNDRTAVWLAAATSFTIFVFTFVSIFTVERFGRRNLLLTSIAGAFFSLSLLTITFYFEAQNSPAVTVKRGFGPSCFGVSSCDTCLYYDMCGFCYLEGEAGSIHNASCVPLESSASTSSRYCDPDFELLRYYGCPSTPTVHALAVVGLVLYLICFAPGLGPIPYVVTAEIFPLWARATGIACTMCTGYVLNLLLSMTFLDGSRLLTKAGWFGSSAGFMLIGWIFVYYLLPEASGRRLEYVNELFKNTDRET